MKKLEPRRVALIQYLTVMVGWGTVGVLVLEAQTSPFNIVFFRCLFAALFLGAVCFLRGYLSRANWSRKNLLLIVAGAVTLVSNWTLLFFSLQLTSLTIATVIYHMQPFFVLLLGIFVLRERVSLMKAGWVLLAFVGLIFTTELEGFGGDALGKDYLLGIACALGAAMLYAVATVTGRQVKGVRPEVISLMQCVVGTFLLLPFATIGDVEWGTGRWLWLVVMGVVHTGILYTLFYASLPKLPTTSIAVLSFVYPATAILIDVVFYDQRLNLLQMLGILVIFASSLGVTLNLGERRSLAAKAMQDKTPDKTPDKNEDKAPIEV